MVTIVYTVIIFMLGLFTKMNDEKARKRFLVLSGIILVLISGLRSYDINSGDTFQYAVMFMQDTRMSFQAILNSGIKDPFYHVFSKCISLVLGNNFSIILIVFSIVYIYSFEKLIQKESPNLLLSFVVFFSMGFFFFSMNGARQSLAIAFVMLAYFPLKEKKLFRFLVFVFIATCFHKTAVIFVVAYPFCRLGFNKKVAFLYLSLIIVLMFMGNTLIHGFALEMSTYDERFVYYAESERALSFAGFIQLCLFFVLTITNWSRFKAEDSDASMLITILVLAMIFQVFAVFIAEMFRVAMYFSTFLVVLVPRLLQTYPPSYRKLLTSILCALLLLYFYTNPNRLNYSFFWN